MKKIFLALMLAFASLYTLDAQITAPAVEERPDTDPKYAEGAAPIVDGHLVLTRTIDNNTVTDKAQVMTKLQNWIDRCMKDERVRYNQPVEHDVPDAIQHLCTLELTFSKSFIAHDFADLTYVLILDASQPEKIQMTMTRIAFKYNEGGKPVKYQGEEVVSDKNTLNKKGRIIYGYRKFRMKTIDLMDELAISLQKEFE